MPAFFKILTKNNMQILEIQHIAPYLPYGVKCIIQNKVVDTIDTLGIEGTYCTEIRNHCNDFSDMKLILRPYSDLSFFTKEIEVNGEKFVPIDFIKNRCSSEYEFKHLFSIIKLRRFKELPYWLVSHLFEWHFDVFELIEECLAIEYDSIAKTL